MQNPEEIAASVKANIFKEAAKGYQQTVKNEHAVEVKVQQPEPRKVVQIAYPSPSFVDLPAISFRRVRQCPADFLVSFIWAIPWASRR